ncbi:unnamed protein product [Acanthoscelides obtectus]|uniref:Uncharacterized protein n=1 Tax=Acanthoscelides obtectus TaxID=200917 RepID=A0A9P0QC67_ACAOB|nr:unnamed protein product [Acanthoscelides obtectus]CAK1672328.1 hypothetical protein AOBTE_LOCUS28793 [Acanthoscelides obtectus]
MFSSDEETSETEETVGLSTITLSTTEQLTRLQIEKEELQLKNLRQQENEAINTQKNDDPLNNPVYTSRLQNYLVKVSFLTHL